MAMNYEFYTMRAREAADAAEKATLDNVRDRALRSEAAWLEMANREKTLQTTREKAQREKDAANAEAALLVAEG